MSGFVIDLLASFQRGIVDAFFSCSNSGARGHIKIIKTDLITQGVTPERNSSVCKPSFFLHYSGCFDRNLPELLFGGKTTPCKGSECSGGSYNDEQLIHGVNLFYCHGDCTHPKEPVTAPSDLYCEVFTAKPQLRFIPSQLGRIGSPATRWA
jgi:hypothetical protein